MLTPVHDLTIGVCVCVCGVRMCIHVCVCVHVVCVQVCVNVQQNKKINYMVNK